eukprot:scaffold414706_cov15-Prasinocladus_malaysianus.AAC.1
MLKLCVVRLLVPNISETNKYDQADGYPPMKWNGLVLRGIMHHLPVSPRPASWPMLMFAKRHMSPMTS